MLRTIVGWVAVDSTDWKTTMQRMNEKLDAALRLYPISPWSDAISENNFVYLRVFVDIWIDGLQQQLFLEFSWQGISIFCAPNFLKTWTPTSAMGGQLAEIWWNAISTKDMVHSCSTYYPMVFFWKQVHPVSLKTSTSSFAVNRLHCKFVVLMRLISYFRVPPRVLKGPQSLTRTGERKKNMIFEFCAGSNSLSGFGRGSARRKVQLNMFNTRYICIFFCRLVFWNLFTACSILAGNKSRHCRVRQKKLPGLEGSGGLEMLLRWVPLFIGGTCAWGLSWCGWFR